MRNRIIYFLLFLLSCFVGETLRHSNVEEFPRLIILGSIFIVLGIYFLFFAVINFNINKWIAKDCIKGDERDKYIVLLVKSKVLDTVLFFMSTLITVSIMDDNYNIGTGMVILVLSIGGIVGLLARRYYLKIFKICNIVVIV